MKVNYTHSADENNTLSTFTVLEPNDYRVKIDDVDFKPTSDQLGMQFIFKFKVVGGEFDGSTVSDYMEVQMPGVQLGEDHKKKINRGERALNSLQLATGVIHFSGDTDDFLNKEVIATVTQYIGNDGKKRNGINKYSPVEQMANTVVNTTPVAPSAPQASAFAGKPSMPPAFPGRR